MYKYQLEGSKVEPDSSQWDLVKGAEGTDEN